MACRHKTGHSAESVEPKRRNLSILNGNLRTTHQRQRGLKITWRTLLLAIGMAGLLQSGPVFAQAGMGMGMGMGASPRFDVAPEIGEQIPDLTIVDDQGNPVNLIDLASQSTYTVLTLGCLT